MFAIGGAMASVYHHGRGDSLTQYFVRFGSILLYTGVTEDECLLFRLSIPIPKSFELLGPTAHSTQQHNLDLNDRRDDEMT